VLVREKALTTERRRDRNRVEATGASMGRAGQGNDGTVKVNKNHNQQGVGTKRKSSWEKWGDFLKTRRQFKIGKVQWERRGA